MSRSEPTGVPATDDLSRISHRYLTFAAREAEGVSPLYVEIATGIARSEPILRFLATFPTAKQQPNLLLAAVRYLRGTAADSVEFERWVVEDADSLRDIMLSRRTQTNEPARCATLLPVLSALPQPLALLEVGAAAGLCLLPDRYGYDYGRRTLLPDLPADSTAPVVPCSANDATPLPARLPQIAWRAGVDLNPLSVSRPDDVKWLESLVWPGQEGRIERLRQAVGVARRAPPAVERGDLLIDLERMAAAAPTDATLVVFHTAVLAYLDVAGRQKFVDSLQAIDAVWVSNESQWVFPHIDRKLPVEVPHGRFILSVNGEPVAFTGPHGQAVEWIEPPENP